jgi:hypothetical protein
MNPLQCSLESLRPLAGPKGYMSCTGQELTIIVDHRQRSLAFMATRDALSSLIAMLLSSVIVASTSEGSVAAGAIGERRLLTWQKQALYGELSEPKRISHPIRH